MARIQQSAGVFCALVCMVALSAAASESHTANSSAEEWAGIKQPACQSFGCTGGPRNCFDGEVTLHHPVYGGVTVHLWCYEP